MKSIVEPTIPSPRAELVTPKESLKKNEKTPSQQQEVHISPSTSLERRNIFNSAETVGGEVIDDEKKDLTHELTTQSKALIQHQSPTMKKNGSTSLIGSSTFKHSGKIIAQMVKQNSQQSLENY